MTNAIIAKLESAQLKAKPADVRSGETVKVHYRIREGGKERIQIFEGLVIGVKAPKTLQGSFTVRKVVDTIGVERTFPLHSPWVMKIERVKSGKVRRAKLNYVRAYALSRRFKLKDLGVSGNAWEEDTKAPEIISDPEPVAVDAEVDETPETKDNDGDESPREDTGSDGGNNSGEVSPDQAPASAETEPAN